MAGRELFFDFETSGLPGDRSSSDLKHSPNCETYSDSSLLTGICSRVFCFFPLIEYLRLRSDPTRKK